MAFEAISCPAVLKRKYRRVLTYIDPEDSSTPRACTVFWSTVFFILFLLFGGFAIGYPRPWMRIAVLVYNSLILIALALLGLNDLIQYRYGIYRRNFVNTIVLFSSTVITMTILYEMIWYQGLNLWILQARQEKLPSFRFPAMYLIQDHAHYQANILDDQPWTCYIGAQDRSAPMCDSMSAEQILDTSSCNCNDSWIPHVLPNFLDGDGGDGKRSLALMPQEKYITHSNVMTIKFRFNYNTTKQSDPELGSPNLWLFVYDPLMPVGDAYTKSTSSMRLFNAHGASTVLLNNHYFISRDGSKRYEYGVVISTTPFMNLVCDISTTTAVTTENQKYTPCMGSLFLNVPGFDSTILEEKRALSWTDVVGQTGAYFALVQLVTWMLSGLAWGV